MSRLDESASRATPSTVQPARVGTAGADPVSDEGRPPSVLREFGSLTPDARRTLRDLAVALAIIGASLTAFVVWRGGRVSAGSPRIGSVQIEGAPPARR